MPLSGTTVRHRCWPPLLASVLAVALSACSGAGPPPEPSPDPNVEVWIGGVEWTGSAALGLLDSVVVVAMSLGSDPLHSVFVEMSVPSIGRGAHDLLWENEAAGADVGVRVTEVYLDEAARFVLGDSTAGVPRLTVTERPDEYLIEFAFPVAAPSGTVPPWSLLPPAFAFEGGRAVVPKE